MNVSRTDRRFDQWLLSVLAGIWMFYVLYVFRGYGIEPGISDSGHSLLFRALCFGLLNAAVFFLMEFQVSRWFFPHTPSQKVIWRIAELLIGVHATFLLFNYFWDWKEWNWIAYRRLLSEYVLLMLIPLAAVHLLAYLRDQRQSVRVRREYLTFHSDNGKDLIRLPAEDLLFLKASGNYIELYFLRNGALKNALLRNTLKQVEAQYWESPYLRRCHRSYLVNPFRIRRMQTSGKKTTIDLGEIKIPVSASYRQQFSS